MTKYLQMNGNTDSVITPSLSFNKIELDVYFDNPQPNAYAYIVSETIGTYVRINNNSLQKGATVTATGFGMATRTTLTLTVSSLVTNTIALFYRGSNGAGYDGYSCKGRIYDAKFYNGSTLIAHYDMSTGTVNDQSGNGNNATLNGGTWLDDGAGATGTPVTYTYDTKQSIYANIQTNYDTKQSIYSNQSTNFDTQQSIYKSITQPYDTKQAIYKAIQELFDTEQVFTQVYTQVSYTYDMKIQQYKDIQESVDTKQAYYTDISVDLDTKQVIYKQIHNLYDTLIQIRNKHDETLYGTLTIQRVIEHRLTINKRHSDDLKIERVLNHILRV